MSPIGRVFLVLNLGLAGAFVAFSGTYLQRNDNWRDKHNTLKKESDAENARLTDNNKGLNEQLVNVKRVGSNLLNQKKGLETKLAESQRDNAALQDRLSSLEGSLKQTTSHLAKLGSEVAAARNDSKASMDKAIAAEKARDEAVAAKTAAEKAQAESNLANKNLKAQLVDQGATLAMANQKIREQGTMLDLANKRMPRIFSVLTPEVTGTVSTIGPSGNTVTIALDSGAENLKAGAQFAIYSARDGYKGEATVSEIDGSKKFCFARLTLKQGKQISTGDNASTNLNGSRSN